MAAVSYEHVTKRFGPGTAALHDLNLRIRDGEFMVLVGESGSGKSTALRLVAGLERPSEGSIRIGDLVVNDLPPGKRDVAMVFQSPALFPNLDVYGNLAFGLQVRHLKEPDVDLGVRRASGALGLLPFLRRRPQQLSYGHQHQAALGRAIARPARVFLLDQPLTGLDAHIRQQARRELQRLHQELRATFLHVTHDQEEAMVLGNRIAVLRNGVLQQVASPRGLYEYPANRYVASFFGSPPMSFLPVVMRGRLAEFAGITLELPRAPGVENAVLGVRAEAVQVVAEAEESTLELLVGVVERVGPAQLVHGTVAGHRLVARVGSDVLVFRHDRVHFRLDPERLHLFDAETDQAFF